MNDYAAPTGATAVARLVCLCPGDLGRLPSTRSRGVGSGVLRSGARMRVNDNRRRQGKTARSWLGGPRRGGDRRFRRHRLALAPVNLGALPLLAKQGQNGGEQNDGPCEARRSRENRVFVRPRDLDHDRRRQRDHEANQPDDGCDIGKDELPAGRGRCFARGPFCWGSPQNDLRRYPPTPPFVYDPPGRGPVTPLAGYGAAGHGETSWGAGRTLFHQGNWLPGSRPPTDFSRCANDSLP